jgi:hypothetical protein
MCQWRYIEYLPECESKTIVGACSCAETASHSGSTQHGCGPKNCLTCKIKLWSVKILPILINVRHFLADQQNSGDWNLYFTYLFCTAVQTDGYANTSYCSKGNICMKQSSPFTWPWRWNQTLKYASLLSIWDTRWCFSLRHCATGWKVTGLIPDGVDGIFHWHNPSGSTIVLRLTQPLTEMSTRNIFWGVKAAGVFGWPHHLHVLIVMKSGSLKLLEPSGPVQGLLYLFFFYPVGTCRKYKQEIL